MSCQTVSAWSQLGRSRLMYDVHTTPFPYCEMGVEKSTSWN